MKYNISRYHNSHGFTLIEIVTVLIVILITIGILSPLIGRSRESAKRAQCANNLRQIGMAIQFYCDEHDGNVPIRLASYGLGANDEWWKEIIPYLNFTGDTFYAPIFFGWMAMRAGI